MLKFKSVSIIFLILTVLIIGSHFVFQVGLFYLLIPGIIYIALLVYGSAFICSSFYIETHCENKTCKDYKVAISFDDGPVAEYTPKILRLLRENDIKAAFFCKGLNIRENPELLKSMLKDGHLIGNHSYSHSNYFDFYTTRNVYREIKKTDDLIYKTIRTRINLFRPPFGVTNPNIAKAVRRLNYTVVGWSIKSLDTVSPDKSFKRITSKIKPGSVILLHDTHAKTAVILSELIAYTKQNNIQIVRLDELLDIQAFKQNPI